MTNSITRQLHVYFSRLMSCSSSAFAHDRSLIPDSVPSPPSSPSPISSSVVFKNYNSLYDACAASTPSSSDTQAASNSAATFTTTTTAVTFTATAAATDSDDSTIPTADTESDPGDPDLSSAIASRRLLPPSSPGRSNAIADPSAFAFGIGVAVPTLSSDPYGDFRRSMEEMAAAMGLLGLRGAGAARRRRRERLYELLLCYLALNRKQAHKYIVGAFADLLVSIAENADDAQEEKEEEETQEAAAEKEEWRRR